MKKLLSIVAGAAIVPVVAFSTVSALGRGQFPEGNFYYSPQNGVAVDPASTTCGNTLTLKVRAHNAGPSSVENTTVRVALPNTTTASHVSTATISSPYADPNAVNDTMTVNLDKAGKLNYVSGSAELLDADNNKLSTLPDTITTTGVNIGEVKVSMQEIRFVQFKVNVACETSEVKNIQVCMLSDKTIVTIKENEFDAAKHSKNLDDCKEVVKHIKVCELATKKIVTIKESEFNSSKYSRDLAMCVEKPAPGEITVCELATKNVMNIKESEFDAAKHSRDLDKCAEVLGTTTETPAVIAATGPASAIATMTGLSALTAGIGYFVQRRRNILG